MRLFGLALLAGLATARQPCALARNLLSRSETGYIPAQVAYDCLTSVPVAVKQNRDLIDELKVLWEWHSEIGWLKNPPSTWELGPVDLLAKLDKIRGSLHTYKSEYDVHNDIHKLTLRTGNFHLNYRPDILQTFFFERTFAIVSISEDGSKTPQIYTADDLIAHHTNSTTPISPISSINGRNVLEFLDLIAKDEQYIDANARFNSLMYRGNQTASLGAFHSQSSYQGPWTNVTFANGTALSSQNRAWTPLDFSAVSSGESFFGEFCTGGVSGFYTWAANAKKNMYKSSLHKRQATIPADKTYPKPIIAHSRGAVAGYFLSSAGYTDIAVLKIITFLPEDDTDAEFQAVIARFLGECARAGKTKLIIDVRENGGGATYLLLDAFMQLFPGLRPYSAQRYRANRVFGVVGEAVSDLRKRGVDLDLDGDPLRFWKYWDFLDAGGETFGSWKEMFGPHRFNNDSFSSLVRYNLTTTNPTLLPPNTTFHAPSPSTSTPHFNTTNTLLLTDALCGSSCASFHEELKNVASIHSIVLGGRPPNNKDKPPGPMQVIGGSKGGEVISLSSIPVSVANVYNLSVYEGGTGVLDDGGVRGVLLVENVLLRAGDLGSRIQVQDQVRKGDKAQTPLQFVYEAADCRLWYTGDMVFNAEKVWERAWGVFFKDWDGCLAGSTGDASSLSGGFRAFGGGEVENGGRGRVRLGWGWVGLVGWTIWVSC